MDFKLTKKAYDNSLSPIYQSDNYDECWFLEIGGKKFIFLINSEIELPPTDVYSDDNIIFFEINNIIFLISRKNGSLLFVSRLFDDFSQIMVTHNVYVVITDTTIMLISKYSYAVIKVAIFPDTIFTVDIQERKIILKTLEEECFEVIL